MTKKSKQSAGFAKKKQAESAAKKAAERRRNLALSVALVAVLTIVLAGISLLRNRGEEPSAESSAAAGSTGGELLSGERPLVGIEPAQRIGYYSAYPDFVIDTANQYEATIVTEKGDIRLALFDDEAPQTVNNFVFLANQGYYDNTTFHRVLEDFMAQAGDPSGTGSGGPGYQFEDETDNGLSFDRSGLLAMANAGPGTNGSQFFITYEPTPWLTGNHTIFGEVIEGEAVLDALTRRDPTANPGFPGDLIERIEITVIES